MAYNLENDINNIDRPMKSYQESKYNPFDAPVAGQSLTKEPGNAAWEHPPQIDSMEEAMGYVWEKLSQEQNYKALAKVISFSGFLEGKWTVDVAKMIEPTVGQMIATMGSTSKVPMKVSIGDKSDSQFIGAMAGNELDLDKAKVASEKSPELNMDELPKTNGLMSKGVV